MRLPLGFGCSSLGSETSYRDGCRLVERAFEAGFRHFDVAPSYGHGHAERIVGDVLQAVRRDVVLVSKAGIPHPAGSTAIRVARRLLLPVKRRFPALWRGASTTARQASARPGQFGVDDIRRSFDETLRRLRTDRLDALLLHEVQTADVTEPLAHQLQQWRQQGCVTALGPATSVAASVALSNRSDQLFDWIQTNHYWGAFTPVLRNAGRLVTHRAMRTGLALSKSPVLAGPLQAVLPHGTSGAQLATLLLRAAVQQAGPGGAVLVSTLQPARLSALVDLATHDPSPELSSAINAVLQRAMAGIADPEALTRLERL